jgi:hypothetical protein
MADLQANLDEIKVHQREAKALLAKSEAHADKASSKSAFGTSNKAPVKPAHKPAAKVPVKATGKKTAQA